VETLELLRRRYDFLPSDNTTVLLIEKDRLKWWTFGGLPANRVLMDALRRGGVEVRSADDFSVSLPLHLKLEELEQQVRALKFEHAVSEINEDVVESMKFAAALPYAYRVLVAAARFVDEDHARMIAGWPVIFARGS
jgi:hypothetical protein